MWTLIPSAHFLYEHGLPAAMPSAGGGLGNQGAVTASAGPAATSAAAVAPRGERVGKSVKSPPTPIHFNPVPFHYLQMPSFRT